MADQRSGGIAWTDETWNPVRGCSRVSPGCEHCYAEVAAARFSKPGQPYHGLAVIGEHGPRWTRVVRLVPEHLNDPLTWKRPRRVFVNSMSDLFHEALSNEDIAAIFGVMAATVRHTFQILTKRPERMRQWFEWLASLGPCARRYGPDFEAADALVPWCLEYAYTQKEGVADLGSFALPPWPLPNVWLGVSVEDQARVEGRIPLLAHVPAAVRFVSYEPGLEDVDFQADVDATSNRFGVMTCPKCRGWGGSLTSRVADVNGHEQVNACAHCQSSGCAIDWVIIGGESGTDARPFDLAWARHVIAQCKATGVAVFMKQVGGRPMETPCRACGGKASNQCAICAGGNVYPRYSAKGGVLEEWPMDLRVREFPVVKGTL